MAARRAAAYHLLCCCCNAARARAVSLCTVRARRDASSKRGAYLSRRRAATDLVGGGDNIGAARDDNVVAYNARAYASIK